VEDFGVVTEAAARGVAANFLEHFKDLKDPRMAGKITYPLGEVLLLAVASTVSDGDGFVDMEDYGKEKLAVLRHFLPYEDGVPTHGQLGYIFARLDGEAFRRCFAAWKKAEGIEDDTADGEEHAGPLPWKVAVAEDGKAARGSRRRKGGNKVMTMVSAFGVRTRTVLAQAKVDQKSNEITAIPKLIEALGDVEGYVFTMDAMGCQRSVASDIVARKANYVLSLKGNQSSLHKDVVLFAAEQKACNYRNSEVTVDESVTKGHGRVETRRTTVIGSTEWLQKRHAWPGLKSVVVVESIRETSRTPDPEPKPEAADGPAQEGVARDQAQPAETAVDSVAAAGAGCASGKGTKKSKSGKKKKAPKAPDKTIQILPDGTEVTTERETRFYISSMLFPATLMAILIRGHWAIENSLHWVLDCVFHEDASRVRTGSAPENLTAVRHAAYNLLRRHEARHPSKEPISMRRRRKKASRSDTFLMEAIL